MNHAFLQKLEAYRLLERVVAAFWAIESCPLVTRFQGKALHDAVPMVVVLMMMLGCQHVGVLKKKIRPT